MKLKAVFFIAICYCVFVDARKLPSFVKACSRNVEDANKCLIDSINHLRPYLIKGIPEMGLPPMDPMTIPFLQLKGGSTLSYTSNLTNIVFTGAKDFTITSAYVSLKEKAFRLTLNIPHFNLNGQYAVNGKILLIEMKSDGDFTGDLTNVTISGAWKAKSEMKKGKEHFIFNPKDVSVRVSKLGAEFKDLFKNNKQLTDNTNRIINENADVLYEEINPVISEGIGQMVTQALNKVHELFSNEELYPS